MVVTPESRASSLQGKWSSGTIFSLPPGIINFLGHYNTIQIHIRWVTYNTMCVHQCGTNPIRQCRVTQNCIPFCVTVSRASLAYYFVQRSAKWFNWFISLVHPGSRDQRSPPLDFCILPANQSSWWAELDELWFNRLVQGNLYRNPLLFPADFPVTQSMFIVNWFWPGPQGRTDGTRLKLGKGTKHCHLDRGNDSYSMDLEIIAPSRQYYRMHMNVH